MHNPFFIANLGEILAFAHYSDTSVPSSTEREWIVGTNPITREP